MVLQEGMGQREDSEGWAGRTERAWAGTGSRTREKKSIVFTKGFNFKIMQVASFYSKLSCLVKRASKNTDIWELNHYEHPELSCLCSGFAHSWQNSKNGSCSGHDGAYIFPRRKQYKKQSSHFDRHKMIVRNPSFCMESHDSFPNIFSGFMYRCMCIYTYMH